MSTIDSKLDFHYPLLVIIPNQFLLSLMLNSYSSSKPSCYVLLSPELPRKGKVNEFVFDDSFCPQVELTLCSFQTLNYFLRTLIKFN